jgi:hypothetical protein
MDNFIEYSFDSLMKKTKKELRIICAENDLKKYKSLNKKPLVKLMLDKIPKTDNILQKESEEIKETEIKETEIKETETNEVEEVEEEDVEESDAEESDAEESDAEEEQKMNIMNTNYLDIKNHYDKELNIDKSTYKTTNDETTPIGCIEEMLSKVPKSFWKKSSIKILDPCCGNGNFNFVAHSLIKKNTDRTDKDIVENTLFFNDLNLERIENVKRLFNDKEFNLNITTEDFLKYSEDEKYDMHIVNPPYAKFLPSGKRAAGNHALFKLFIEKSLKTLKKGGFLVYIIPDSWMSLSDSNKTCKMLTEFQFHWLDIHSAKKKWFPRVGSSFTWFVLEKTPHSKPFNVSGVYKQTHKDPYPYETLVESQVRDYIPLLYNSITQSILSKVIDTGDKYKKFKIETSSYLHKYTKRDLIRNKKDEVYKYRLIHTPSQTVYASKPHKWQKGYKVFIPTTNHYNKLFIDNCGMTQSIVFIRCKSKKEAQRIKKILEHPVYIFINNICRWANYNNIRILQRFSIPENLDNIFEAFDISKDEKELIEKFT